MHRRRFLRGGAGGALAALAGCGSISGPRDRSTPDGTTAESTLRIVDFETAAAADGGLLLRVTVRNHGEARATATLAATVVVDDRRADDSVEVTADPGAELVRELTFDVPAEAFDRRGSLQLDLS